MASGDAVEPIFCKAVSRSAGIRTCASIRIIPSKIATVAGLTSFFKANHPSPSGDNSFTPKVHSINWSMIINTDAYKTPFSEKTPAIIGKPMKPIFPNSSIA